ncbi:hypothetical protein KP509_25G029600 [Ceratopteris richardii]|uniref:AAA+ ATPase domain-containing protein n=1 Tax=Ceratopteris richardii TaxID=49495 RepID=A0A8T2RR75_CERRI|nr:hypothetical protein KP509_25G029600 [Ceratopteris richardii]
MSRKGILKDRKYSGITENLTRKLKHTDSSAEIALSREYNKVNPNSVIVWYERSSPQKWYKPAFLAEYLKALVKVDKLDEHELLVTLRKGVESKTGIDNARSVPSPAATLHNSSIEGMSKSGVLGSASSPIHMITSDVDIRPRLWQLFRLILLLYIVISSLEPFTEDQQISKGLRSNEEVQPSIVKGTTFDDIKGVDEAKAELQEIVQYLKDPKRFTVLGGKLPKGILLTGPPGTGKTMLARAIAGEAGVPFFYASGSEFEEMFVGVGARRIRDLFGAAKKHAPCIVFIDEIDAIGGMREPTDHQDARMTLNQLLVELDGFQQNEGVIFIAATNFPQSLDKALVRPGRFDQQVDVPYPDVEGRRQILELYLSKVVTDKDVDPSVLARGTPGLAGADLANLVNVAALKAAMDGSMAVTMQNLDYAKDRLLMGNERKTAVLTGKSKQGTAYHEGGHALVAILTEGAMPVHKATIIPRGAALGMVLQLPEDDKLNLSRKQMLAAIRVSLAGRAAEEIIFGDSEVTSGASNDLEKATELARKMVAYYGMSTTVGPIVHDYKSSESMSTETRHIVESEVRRLLDEAYEDAKQTLITHKEELHALARALIEHETLTGTQIKELIAKVNTCKERRLLAIDSVPGSLGKQPAPAVSVAEAGAAAAPTNMAAQPVQS